MRENLKGEVEVDPMIRRLSQVALLGNVVWERRKKEKI